MAIEPGSERKITLDVALLDHGEHRVAAAVEIRVEPLVVGRKPTFDCAQQEDVEIAVECRIAEGDNILIGRKGGDADVIAFGNAAFDSDLDIFLLSAVERR